MHTAQARSLAQRWKAQRERPRNQQGSLTAATGCVT
ncbi:MAG: hypothetical protein ACRD10_11765 [Terriglobia bacterium]